MVNHRYHLVDPKVDTRIPDLHKEKGGVSLVRYENIFFRFIRYVLS